MMTKTCTTCVDCYKGGDAQPRQHRINLCTRKNAAVFADFQVCKKWTSAAEAMTFPLEVLDNA